MKTSLLNRKVARFGIILALAGLGSLAALAQPRPGSRRPVLPGPGIVVQAPPMGFVTLNFGNSFYYMSGGVFYQRAPHGFVVVAPPAGLRVAAVPPGARRVRLNGASYYSYNNVFFQHARGGGFIVVNPPPSVVVVAPPVVIRPAPPVIVRPMPVPVPAFPPRR